MRRRIILLTLLAATSLFAFQWTNQKKSKPRDPSIRTLQGIVTMADESPVEGAVVKIKNLKTLQIRSFITQTDGKYNFQNLSTSVDYEVRADWKEMASPKRMLTVYDTRYDAVINLKLEPAKKDGDAQTSADAAKPESK